MPSPRPDVMPAAAFGTTVCMSERLEHCLQAYPAEGTPAYIFNWENTGPAVALLLAQATDYKVTGCLYLS